MLFGAHLLCATYFEPPAALLGPQPVSGCDFDTHIEQTWRVLEGLRQWGHGWVYDVHLLAGHPNGVIFDADNKGWEWFTYLLVSLGVRRALAFNAFVILAHLAVVPVIYVSARLFELTRAAALLAAALGSALWFFDSHVHWIWWVGTLAYAFASYFFLLPLALFYRFCMRRSWLHALLCAPALGLCLLIHPYSFFLLVVPMGLLYLRGFRSFRAREHIAVVGVALGALALNASWLIDSLRQWHYILDSGYLGQAGLGQAVADFFGFVVDISTSGTTPNRTSLRWLCFGAAAFTLQRYAKHKDARLWPLGATLAFLIFTAYLGSYWKVGAQIQPYRLIDGAIFLATLPAGEFLLRLCTEPLLSRLAPLARAMVVLLSLLFVKQVGNEVGDFFPDLLPKLPVLYDRYPSPITATGYAESVTLRQTPDLPVFWLLPRWVAEHTRGSGRFLVQNGPLGEQLAWKTDAEIIGGFIVRNLTHARANLFRRRLESTPSVAEVRAYLEAYAIEWVVLSLPDPWLSGLPGLFDPSFEVGGATVLHTRVPISRFEQGHGTLTALTNRIVVRHSDPKEDLVLRYHYHEALGCSAGCRVEPHANPVGGVPFIRVPAPHPSDFSIVNTYRLRAAPVIR